MTGEKEKPKQITTQPVQLYPAQSHITLPWWSFPFSLSHSLTYIHNWSLKPFSQDYDLASHTTYVVCVNFIHKWRDIQFKVDSE